MLGGLKISAVLGRCRQPAAGLAGAGGSAEPRIGLFSWAGIGGET